MWLMTDKPRELKSAGIFCDIISSLGNNQWSSITKPRHCSSSSQDKTHYFQQDFQYTEHLPSCTADLASADHCALLWIILTYLSVSCVWNFLEEMLFFSGVKDYIPCIPDSGCRWYVAIFSSITSRLMIWYDMMEDIYVRPKSSV